MKSLNRRTFLKQAAVTAAAFSLPAASWARVPGANDDIRVAVIGFGGRGQDHIKSSRGLAKKGVRVVALCDVDSRILAAGVESCRKLNEDVQGYTDLRKLLENQDVDVVTTASPNHWHALATIWAVQADKDVYVEKPVCHNVWEGGKMVEAARQYGKIVQTGTQSRSSHGIKEAVEWVSDGNLGKVRVARGLCYKPRRSIGKVDGPQPLPPNIDYDLWCGPAPKESLLRKRLHYDWHWVWSTGNGDLGNQGIHQMDIARWFLGVNELSPRVFSIGGRLGYVDDGQTPNTQIVYHDYEQAPLIFEVRGLPRSKEFQTDNQWSSRNMDRYPNPERGGDVCVVIECEGGQVLVPNYSGALAYDKEGQQIKRWEGASNHFENFIDAVRSRKHTDLNADIQEGFLSSSLCHTGNISYRLGKQASPDEIREKIKGDKDAVATFERMQQHLAANEVDINLDKLILGEFLKMNPRSERFIGNPAADALLTREYRPPFVVPDKV
jgi:predicted dehydrogenase